jgi:hypothetical protein
MTVGELRAQLASLPEDMQVVLSKDGEGNGYSPLDQATTGLYEPETTWSGEFREEHIKGNHAPGEDQSYPQALCLWPVN